MCLDRSLQFKGCSRFHQFSCAVNCGQSILWPCQQDFGRTNAKSDKYDFDMKPWSNPLNRGRNIETKIGERVVGKGTKYEMNIYGSKTLKPILPWLK